MACKLSPIHYWVFEQARLADARGRRLAAALSAGGHAGVEAAWRAALNRHPADLDGRPLESFITGSVHEGMEALVATVCAREAALFAFARAAGGPARRCFAEAFIADGRQRGTAARAGLAAGDARAVFASLKEAWLEGMPCHVEIEVDRDEPGHVAWRRRGLPLAKYWELPADAALELADLHVAWMAAFVEGCSAQRLEGAAWPEGGEGAQSFRILAQA
jgi:hypothetical protein